MGRFFDGYLMRPFFFKVRRAEVETFAFTFWPLMTKVRLETLGLKTLRVFLWEKETLWPYILPLPVISQTAMLFLLHSVNDCFECFGVVDGEVGEDFAVEVDTFSLHTSDELGVGKAKLAGSVVDAGNPKGTEVALFAATIAVSVAKGFDDALLGETVATSAIVLHAFGGLQSFLVFSVGRNAAFDSHD